MSFRIGFCAGLVVAVFWGIYMAPLWPGQCQVYLHSVGS